MNSHYQQRISLFSKQLTIARRSANQYSIYRGLLFLTGFVFLAAFVFSLPDFEWVWLGIAGVIGLVFYRLVLVHLTKIQQVADLEALIKLNESEICRLNLQMKELDNGDEFKQPEHPYHLDLDIFGNHSLFQLVNRCQIPESKALLAKWMSEKAGTSEIKARQLAAQELAKDLNWCQEFQSKAMLGLEKRGKRSPGITQLDLIDWAKREDSIKFTSIWKPLTIITTVLSVGLLLAVLLTSLPYQILYLLILPNGFLLTRSVKQLNALSKGIDQATYLIETFQNTIQLFENKQFKGQKLNELQQKIQKPDPASKAIKKLYQLSHRLNARSNMLYLILDGFFLLDAYLLIDLYRWKQSHHHAIENWMVTINEMECLISLAGFSFMHPNYCFPEVDEHEFHFKGRDIGHPLIASEERVSNDYDIQGKGSIDILTGSNMSGKSTFERTIGINMVLAQMGAPVNATALSMGRINIFTSMRTIDDLSQHTSSFYAELKRISQLLASGKSSPTFVVIDEVLKGTNSEDRHIGAMALVKKLSGLNTFGIISTHDLALGKETKELDKVRNFSFNSEIKEDQILFDYKLTPGLCKSFNASKLMEKMGIID